MITQELVKRLLDYNAETGEVIWRVNRTWPNLVGQRAGWFDKSTGYWKVNVCGYNFVAAKLIWLWFYGKLPKLVPDHIDCDRSNDKLDNLRLATKGQNAANSKMNIRNTSGLKGVSFSNATGRWRADICVHGTKKNLGLFDTLEEAHQAWYNEAVAAWGQEFVRVE